MSNQEIAQFYLSPMVSPRGNWTHYWHTMEKKRMAELVSSLVASGDLMDYTAAKLKKLPL
jgi:hypothetical protein